MTGATQQMVRLGRYPQGLPTTEDFRMDHAPWPEPGAGQVLLRVLALSVDPYLRSLLAGRHLGQRPALGAVMPGMGLARVLASEDPALPVGSLVVGDTGWCQIAVASPAALRRVAEDDLPMTTALGVLGIPGLTAWAGMRSIAKPAVGETVLVSTAAGAVGSVAGQLAKRAGCRVVGIAGGAAKCRVVVEEFGFDACIDRHADDLKTAVRVACPDGVDVYFDNVGGSVLEAALACLRPRARIVLCGLASQYNADTPPPGPNLGPVIGARARMEGLVVYDHLPQFDAFRAELAPLLREGSLKYREQVYAGLAQAPQAFVDLMQGRNLGKALVRLAD